MLYSGCLYQCSIWVRTDILRSLPVHVSPSLRSCGSLLERAYEVADRCKLSETLIQPNTECALKHALHGIAGKGRFAMIGRVVWNAWQLKFCGTYLPISNFLMALLGAGMTAKVTPLT